MERPNDIPQDVWDRAAVLFGHEARARAILAERERCAAVADDHAQVLRQSFDRSCAIAVEGVAAAIRAGGKP